MKKIIIFIIFIISFFSTKCILANDTQDAQLEILDELQIENYDKSLEDEILSGLDFSFSGFVKGIITGEYDFNTKNIFNYIMSYLFKEILINSKIIKNIALIAILCSFLKALTDSFKNKGVTEIGFYAGYTVIAMLVINSFNLALNIITEATTSICNIINTLVPLLSAVLFISSDSISALSFIIIIVVLINIFNFAINNIFVPLMQFILILNIVNYITPKEVLNKLIGFLKWLAIFVVRALAIILTFVISFQKITSPITNTIINKTAKTAINFVPIVGDVINGAIDSVMNFVYLIKGAVGIGIIVIILIACIFPILKLICFIFIYKITAILIEPISDRRITSCIDSNGEYSKMLVSTLVTFVFLFILLIAIMLSITS